MPPGPQMASNIFTTSFLPQLLILLKIVMKSTIKSWTLNCTQTGPKHPYLAQISDSVLKKEPPARLF